MFYFFNEEEFELIEEIDLQSLTGQLWAFLIVLSLCINMRCTEPKRINFNFYNSGGQKQGDASCKVVKNEVVS